MILRPDEQIYELSSFLKANNSRWNYANKILYDMCAEKPMHVDANVIVGKIWIIGRTYAAAIERRKSNTDFKGDFYYDIVAPKMLSIGHELDERISKINQFTLPTDQNVDLVLNTHKFLTDAFYEITSLEKRSLASKYLHFHCPDMFYIYDSYADTGVKNRVKLDKERAYQHYPCGCDVGYTDFYIRTLELREFITEKFGKILTPREMDNFLLSNIELSNPPKVFLSH